MQFNSNLSPGPFRVAAMSGAVAAETGCSLRSIPQQVTQKKGTLGKDGLVVVVVVVVSDATRRNNVYVNKVR